MGQISVSLPVDGETIDASDYNTPITTIVNEINGELDNSNIASDAAIAGTKFASSALFDREVNDTSGNEVLQFASTASAVNELTITNAATGNAPSISATGSDTDIDLELTPKGTGNVTTGGYPMDWWQEIKRNSLTSSSDSLTVSSIPARKYLKVYVETRATGGTNDVLITFNGDTGNNYAIRLSTNGGADTTSASRPNLSIAPSTAGVPNFAELSILNIADKEKAIYASIVSTNTTGAANAPERRELVGKWANTSDQISSITITNGTGSGDFAAGSEIIVLGHD